MTRQKLSIHGHDVFTGRRGEGYYNPNPQEPKRPTTARGRRRAAVKLARKQAEVEAKAKKAS